MPRIARALSVVGLSLFSLGAVADGPSDRAELEAFLDGAIGLQLDTSPSAGATVAVVKDGQLLLAKGYGLADVERHLAVDPAQTLFRSGSVSKLFTWTAVMQLVEQGRLDLDADVNSYLQRFKIPPTFAEPVTLRNLITHTAGFEDGLVGYMSAPTEADLTTLEHALAGHMPKRVRPPARDFGDGTDCVYSNWGTALAGYIVEVVSGMPFDDYVERHIFAPLGMRSSTFREPLPPDLAARLSGGYMLRDGTFVPRQFELGHDFAPAGSLSNTATDMAQFMIAHLQPETAEHGRILKPETQRLMHAHALGASPLVNGMALGFFESRINGRRVLGHGGSGLAFHAQLLLVPDAGTGLFVSYNTSEASGAGSELLQAFMDHYFPAELAAIKPPTDAVAHNAQYVGTYRTLRRSYTKIDKLIAAGGDVVVRALPDGALLFNATDGRPARWVEIADGVYRRTTDGTTSMFKHATQGGELRLMRSFVAEPMERISTFESFSTHGWVLLFAIVLFISMLVSAVRQRHRDRSLGSLQWARPVLALGGALLLGFVLTFVATLMALDDLIATLLSRIPAGLYIALTLALLAIPAIALSLFFVVAIWRRARWSWWARVHYTLTTAAAIGVLAILQYWNLIGYRFG